ncbi:MAG: B12-binding domain-containing radical SAM protein [Planctomycetia bacterium]|nr:B12-binding domain-containing radical SAM protein [Planctomycetia bacterium]
MELAQVSLTVQHKDRAAQVDGCRIIFSPHQCFARDSGEDDVRCLNLLAKHLTRESGLAVCIDGRGEFLEYFLNQVPSLRNAISCVIAEKESDAGWADFAGLAVVTPDRIPAGVTTVFLCETLTFPRMRMRKWLPDGLKFIEPDVLQQLGLDQLPARAWSPWARDTIYPIDIPEIEFIPGLDMLLIDCPARNLGLMPNGLGYVDNALKHVEVRHQTLDIDIIIYHRFHIRRLFDEGGKMYLPNGKELPTDPWQAEHYDVWTADITIDFFEAEVREIVAKLLVARPKVLGLSIHGCNERFSKEVVKRVKEAAPEIMVLVGGFACYSPDIGLRGFPLADYMCVGESDLTVGPLVERLARGERPGNVPGVLSKFDDPAVPYVPAPMVHNLDLLEHPHYEWYDLDVYRNYNGYQLTPVIASRGCRWSRCTFCAERFYWRIRSPKAFVDELEWLVDRGCRLFMFNESDLNGKPEIVLEICDEIIRRGLRVKLTGQLRIHKKSDQAFFQKLRKAGFVALRFGVDAFSENTLRLQKKGYTTETVSQNLKDCWEAGIYTEVNWVIGVPGETEQDIDEGIELILANKKYIGRLANINPLILVTGGVYWLQPEEHNIHFRRPKEELYHEFPRALPANSWYSTEPYIDEHVRKARFERIVLELHRRNFDVGSWAARVIEDVHKNRDKARSGPAEEAPDSGTATDEAPATRKLSEGVGGMKPGQAADPKSDATANANSGESSGESTMEFNPDARTAAYVFRAGSSLPEDKVHYFRSYLYVTELNGEMYGIEPAQFEEAFGTGQRQSQMKRLGCIDLRARYRLHSARTKTATPELIDSIGDYNIVQYDGLVYGLPQVSPVNPDDFRRQEAEKIGLSRKRNLVQDSVKQLKRVVRRILNAGRQMFSPGQASTPGAVVASSGLLYPLDVRWGEDNIAAFPGVVTGKTFAETMSLVEKITGERRRRMDCEAAENSQATGASGALPIVEAPAVPQLVGSLEGYNIVEYEGWFYGIPQSLGNMELDKVDVIENPQIIRDLSREVVEGEIREVLRAAVAA